VAPGGVQGLAELLALLGQLVALAVFVVPEAEEEALLLQELVDLLAGEADLAADVGGGEQGYPPYGYLFVRIKHSGQSRRSVAFELSCV